MFLLGWRGVGRGRQFEEQSQSSDLKEANYGKDSDPGGVDGESNASGEVQPVPAGLQIRLCLHPCSLHSQYLCCIQVLLADAIY